MQVINEYTPSDITCFLYLEVAAHRQEIWQHHLLFITQWKCHKMFIVMLMICPRF